jgi:aminoglycoside 6'-N-acetyltransferase
VTFDVPLGGYGLRPLEPSDEEPLRRIRATPEVWRWWDDPEDGWPLADDPEATRLVIERAGEVVGLIQYYEENEPKYRHASIDMFLAPEHHGRGLGTAVLRRVAHELFEERGHHRITIDPAADNDAAIRAYEKVGFRPVGVMRKYERDTGGSGWHDGLLMELLAEDFQPGSQP